MKIGFLKTGLLALVAVTVSLQAVYNDVTVLSFINELSIQAGGKQPEIAYRVLNPDNSVIQDWKVFSGQQENVNIVLKRKTGRFEKLEFKGVGYDSKGWYPVNYKKDTPSFYYQPDGYNKSLHIKLKEFEIEEANALETTVKINKVRIVSIQNSFGVDAIATFSDGQEFNIPKNSTVTINMVSSMPLSYIILYGDYWPTTGMKPIPDRIDPSLVDKDGIVNFAIIWGGKNSSDQFKVIVPTMQAQAATPTKFGLGSTGTKAPAHAGRNAPIEELGVD